MSGKPRILVEVRCPAKKGTCTVICRIWRAGDVGYIADPFFADAEHSSRSLPRASRTIDGKQAVERVLINPDDPPMLGVPVSSCPVHFKKHYPEDPPRRLGHLDRAIDFATVLAPALARAETTGRKVVVPWPESEWRPWLDDEESEILRRALKSLDDDLGRKPDLNTRLRLAAGVSDTLTAMREAEGRPLMLPRRVVVRCARGDDRDPEVWLVP